MQQITVQRIEIEASGENAASLLVTLSNGTRTYFGHNMTPRGAKNMLVRRAKQFGLIVQGTAASKPQEV